MAIRFDPASGQFVEYSNEDEWRARMADQQRTYDTQLRGYTASMDPWAARAGEYRRAQDAQRQRYQNAEWTAAMAKAKDAYSASLDAVGGGGQKPDPAATPAWGDEGRPTYSQQVSPPAPDGQSYENWLASLGGGRAKEDYLDEMKGQEAAQFGFSAATSPGGTSTFSNGYADWMNQMGAAQSKANYGAYAADLDEKKNKYAATVASLLGPKQ